MKKMVLPLILIIVILFLVGSAFAATTGDKTVMNVKTIQSHQSTATLMDHGSNKFYWGERGGIFSYNWKTYRTSKGSLIVVLHYKTYNNSWYGSYSIIQSLNHKLKIVNTGPEVMLYSGHPSSIYYKNTSLSPDRFYWSMVRGQIKSGGYYT